MIFLKRLLQRSSSVLVGFIVMVNCSILLPAQNNCPDVQIIFDIPPVVCFDPGNSNVDLEVDVVGSDGTGTGQWSGQNISNTTAGIFRTTFASPGQQKVYYTYTEGSCTYQDSTTFLYSRLSTPVFLASSEQAGHLCQDSFSILRVISNYDETTTNLVWDLAGGTPVEKDGLDSLHVNWTTPGSKLIKLQYEQFGCLSQPIFQQVVLDPTIDDPVVACDNSLESVVFEWEDPPNSSATVVFVISGPNGVADTTADRYTIENLLPGQIVQVRLVTSSNNTCDGNFVEPLCESITCDGDIIDLTPIEKVCVSGGMTDTIDLNYVLSDTITPSTLTWSGAGVFDPTQARIAVDPTMAGQTQWVFVEFQSANCTVRDSVSFELIPPPIADFNISSTTCIDESITANFAFGPLDPASDTTLIWGFDGATVSGDPNTGSVNLSWSSPGTKTISLALQDGACVSDTVYRFVNVQTGPEAAQIDCNAGPNSILFSWQNIPSVTYDIKVLEGLDGTMPSTTSYLVSGLSENQQLTIEVTTKGAGICNTATATATCSTVVCPDISLAIEPIPPVCVNTNSTPVNLNATITGSNGNGILRWSGPNVTGTTWTPDNSLFGQTLFLYSEYQEGNCTYKDSIEVQVLEQAVADFNLDATSCISDITTVEASGTFQTGSSFDWQINGISNSSLVGPGPHDLTWDTPGNKQVGLVITNASCSSNQVNRTIQVQAALPEPMISCEPDVDQILFTWNPVPGAMEYIVEVLQGPAGSRTSDTSIVFSGLSPGQEIEIAVVLENGGACDNSRSEISCRVPGCHDVTVTIDQSLLPESVCITDQDSVFQLNADVVTSIGTGILTFSGMGVSDADRTWTATSGMAGQTITITAVYTEDGCTFTDEVEVAVYPPPIATFTVDSLSCRGDTITLEFTGQASPDAVFNWSVDSLSGIGPHRIVFEEMNSINIELTVQDNNCSSETFKQEVDYISKHTEPVVFCEQRLDEIIYSWVAPDDDMRTEITLIGSGTGTRTSDTSYVVSNLPPETSSMIEIQFVNDMYPCRNSDLSQAECSTSSCDDQSINWSAPLAICGPQSVPITFTTQGAGSSGFDVAIRLNGQTMTYSGITQGSTLNFDLDTNTELTMITAGLPGNSTCSVNLPASLNITVNTPVTIGNQTVFPSICEGVDTLINLNDLFDNGGYIGQWTYFSGPEDPGSTFDDQNGTIRSGQLSAGDYWFQFAVGTPEGCEEQTVDLTINIQNTPVADAGPDLSLDCQFNIASLGSNLTTTGMNYLWTGDNGNIITDPDVAITEVSQAGNYSLMVINPTNGCSASDDVVVSASPGMIIPYTTVFPNSCYDSQDGIIRVDSILGGQAPYTFSLNGNSQGNQTTFGNLVAGSYDLQVSSNDGCEATLLLQIEAPVELALELTSDLQEDVVTLGDSVMLTALINIPPDQIAEISWLPDPDNTSGSSLTQMVYPLITSSYGVEIKDINGCMISDRLTIIVQKNNNIFIPTAFSPNEDGSNDIFYLQSDQTVQRVIQFSIYDRWGKQVFARQNFQTNDPVEGWDGNTRNSPQPPGVYVYWVELELASGELIQMSGDVALLR